MTKTTLALAVATILAYVCGVVDPWATLESSVPLKLRGQRKMSRFRLLMVALSLFHGSQVARAQEQPIAIVAGTIIDGSGKVLHNTAENRSLLRWYERAKPSGKPSASISF